MIFTSERANHQRWNPKISWGGRATAVEATAKHDGANRSFGVDLTWRTWRVDLAGQLPSAALELPNLRRGCSIGAEGGREGWCWSSSLGKKHSGFRGWST